MLLYINYDKRILGYHEDINKKDSQNYVNESGCIWVEDLTIEYPEHDKETQYVDIYLNDDMTVRYEIMDIIKACSANQHEKLTSQIHNNVEMETIDNLINMDMLLTLDEKLNTILEHLGL